MDELRRCIKKAGEYMDRVAGLTDEKGTILYATDEAMVGDNDYDAHRVMMSNDQLLVTTDRVYRPLHEFEDPTYCCFVDGNDAVSQAYLEILAQWFIATIQDKTNTVDKKAFIKNILLENELPGDIPLKAREYRVLYNCPRVVYLVRVPEGHGTIAQTILLDWVNHNTGDFVVTMEENMHVIVKVLDPEKPRKDAVVGAKDLAKLLKDNGCENIHLGIGMTVDTLKDCAKSYREAALALTIGDIFAPEEELMFYNRLGLGRLIYQLPPTLCRMFLEEVFPNDSYDELDDETLTTIDKFFENNLNGSETSRQLYVHRNTLVYRLDKVQKTTDLDLRNFDDAVLFKLAAMVRKYLEKQAPNALNQGTHWFRS